MHVTAKVELGWFLMASAMSMQTLRPVIYAISTVPANNFLKNAVSPATSMNCSSCDVPINWSKPTANTCKDERGWRFPHCSTYKSIIRTGSFIVSQS